MTGPASPSTEGPTFAPPQLPPGWIAQWDSSSKKYYYVQLATGVSQWEIPTEAAKTGSTPAQHEDHPYGVPPPEIITHPDGSQTVKHADGRLEPIMADGSRGLGDGPSGDRGIGVRGFPLLPSCPRLASSTSFNPQNGADLCKPLLDDGNERSPRRRPWQLGPRQSREPIPQRRRQRRRQQQRRW